MHCTSIQHQFTVVKKRAARVTNLLADMDDEVSRKKLPYFITFLVAKNEVLVGGHENFVEELERAFGVLKSSVVRDFKCGLELRCLKERTSIFKQFPRTSEQMVSAKKDKDHFKK